MDNNVLFKESKTIYLYVLHSILFSALSEEQISVSYETAINHKINWCILSNDEI